jgi:type I restriction enzyme S subunit
MGYAQYNGLENSGVVWLQDVPRHWRIKRLKFSADLVNSKVSVEDSPLPYIGLEHIESWSGRKIDGEISNSEGLASAFSTGDVLFGKLRPYLAKVHLAQQDGLISSEALVVRSKAELRSDFLKYYMLSSDFINIVDSSTYGSKMPRASWDFVGNLPVLLPEVTEQQAIASFLDLKTEQIDALITKQQALLEKLGERRTALISHAVTKGLNLSVPRRNSGVSWLGDVPISWDVKRLKFVLSSPLKYGANEAAELTDADLPRYIRITDVNEDGTLREETFRSLPLEVARDYLLADGDILLARSGATVGKTFIYKASWGVAAYAGYLIRARLSEQMDADFMYLFLQSTSYWQWLNSVVIQATIQNVSAEKYANLIVPVPPVDDQKMIVTYLFSILKKIDAQKAATEHAIEKLKEYRSAIITNAVTGKIDVRDFHIPLSAASAAT